MLDLLLDGRFPGAADLRAQAATARVTGGCAYGCPTVDLEVDGTAPAAEVEDRAAVEADGGLIVFVDEGQLSRLEYWTLRDERPVQFPPLERNRNRKPGWISRLDRRPSRSWARALRAAV
ncbi:hypothetical protein AB0L41_35580 [Amycolatopsis mediterranei]|uniref:hypothetical protein n=1 Tax=Amycolatopsis mediterranei TaxID=33910 RepID=UPI00343A5C6F